MLSNILDRISFWFLFTVIVLLPIFFLPFTDIPVETSKGLLLVMGLAISIIFWIAARFSDGKISIPKSWLLFSAFGVSLAFFVSALFSSSLSLSLFGIMLDVGTFYFMLAAFLLMLFSSIILKDIKNARTVFWGLIVSSTVLFIFQGLRLFLPDLLSLGILGGKTDNILGSWNTFGIFAGFITVISVFVIEFFSTSKLVKWLLGILVLLSILLSALVNFSLIWELLGIFSLIVFVYKVSFFSSKKQTEDEKIRFPALSFAIVLISLLFFMSSQTIGSFLPNRLSLSNIEIGPSFSATIQVAKGTLTKDPVLGVGPNKFIEAWSMYKPGSINNTDFWDSSFNFGSGLFPTFAATTGILGILTLLSFLFLFIMTGVRSLFSSIKHNTNWEIVIFFVASLYLFVSSFFYSTGGVVFLLAFAFTGIFIGLSFSSYQNGEFSFSFLDDPRKSFFSILLLVILMIASAAVAFKYTEKLISVSYFGKTLYATTVPEAEGYINKAISLHQNDLYLRTFAQVYLSKINSVVSKGTTSISDADKADLQTSFDQAIGAAQLAISYDRGNYMNYTSLGFVYNTAGTLGVKDAYDKAIEAYKTASTLNPLNPGIKLTIARILFNSDKTSDARDYTKQSLDLKPDYIDALVVLSQIEKKDGNNSSAVSYAEQALSLAPSNQDLINYVNTVKGGGSANIPVSPVPSPTPVTTTP